MPIKPENKGRYPANWKQIRAEILMRASCCCEQCKAPNRRMIARGVGHDVGTYITEDGEVYDDANGAHRGLARLSEYEYDRWIEVVLTIAHLDHTPENCDPDNLRAWCQRCHLAYDAEHHRKNAAKTRRDRKAVADLFD